MERLNRFLEIEDYDSKNKSEPCGKYLFIVFSLILSLVAVYLSHKCNNGFDFSSFLMAIIFPYFYIVYIFATRGLCNAN